MGNAPWCLAPSLRQTPQLQCHLPRSSHLPWSHLLSLRLMSFHLMSFRPLSSHQLSSHQLSSHQLSLRLMSFHLMSFRPLSSHQLSSHQLSLRLVSFRLLSSRHRVPLDPVSRPFRSQDRRQVPSSKRAGASWNDVTAVLTRDTTLSARTRWRCATGWTAQHWRGEGLRRP
jgi:hypothetical protein